MRSILSTCVVYLFALALSSAADYSAWTQSGSLFIITTPEGAHLPASASEANFPLLVRLNSGTFNFAQAQNDGRDLRFAIQGAGTVAKPATALAYQVEQWDATKGAAVIWVMVPTITGNSRQEIKMYWGNAAATSESSGAAVFNSANGFAAVLHMNDNVEDSVGAVKASDMGTTVSTGMIGNGRRFDGGKGLNFSSKITNFAAGDSPHSSELWMRCEVTNTNALGWGMDQPQGKVVMQLASPPHINMDCWFSAGNVAGKSILPMAQWIHVAHTYTNGQAKLYVNGVLDGSNGGKGTMNIPNPATMKIGGWDRTFDFVGDIDEVRISTVARSADWVKMEFENQKPLQTLVGAVVQAGTIFTAKPATVTMNEGASTVLNGQAGGAQKVYWSRVENGMETPIAVDQLTINLNAGRVTANQSYVMRFKGIYPTGAKTVDIPVTVTEYIPDPVFTVNAPATWNGRDIITVTPNITNLATLTAKGANTFNYSWKATGVAVTKSITPGTLSLLRSQGSGTLTVALTMDNGGERVTSTKTILIQEPATDAWVARIPGATEKAVNNQFYARDDSGKGKLYYNGTLAGSPTSVFLKLYTTDTGTDVAYSNFSQPLVNGAYAFTAPLASGLVKYKAVFGSTTNGVDTILDTVTNLVCGDAYIIEGQSNAEATAPGSETTTNTWVRTYGRDKGAGWGDAVRSGTNMWIGYWGMDLGLRLSTAYHVPICIINGAVGGTRIDQHQANPANHYDTSFPYAIYGNLVTRMAAAKLSHGIRAVLWHQGEQDQGSGGPSGDFAWKSHHQYFVDMSAAWKQDYPNLSHYYIYQIWPAACGDTSACDQLREAQRTLPSLFSKMRIMSTLGIVPGSGCHYEPAGYKQFVTLMSPLLELDFYGAVPTSPITAPNVKKAYYTSTAKNEIAIDFGQEVIWNDKAKFVFYLDGVMGKVVTGSATGNIVKLQLTAPSTASTITYIKGTEFQSNQSLILRGANGIAALTFYRVPVLPSEASEK